jgi:hypothetical protein|tara:strand:+ start:339 stop:506 length:168 start_codon:yes stop_codon:yes gene_type:complete
MKDEPIGATYLYKGGDAVIFEGEAVKKALLDGWKDTPQKATPKKTAVKKKAKKEG